MDHRKLGQTGVSVSAIGLGCWGMSGAYGAADQQEAEATLHHALDAGISLLDERYSADSARWLDLG